MAATATKRRTAVPARRVKRNPLTHAMTGATFKPAHSEKAARTMARVLGGNGERVKVEKRGGKWGCWTWGKKGNPPASIHREVAGAAKDVARRGGHGYAGESLPNLMSGEAVDWINNNQRVFQQMVSTQRLILSKRGILKRNPEAAAASLYEMFHGGPSEGETVVHEDVHVHEHLGELGVLGGLKVRTVTGYEVTLEFIQDKANNPRKDVVSKVGSKTKGWIGRRTKALSKLASGFGKTWLNPRGKGPVILCANEDGDSMYLRSGDQALDLDKLHLGGEFKKDSVVIGEVWLLGYITEKSFDDWKNLFYVHGLGDEDAHPKIGKKKDLWDDAKPPEKLFGTGQLPLLIYDRPSELLSFSGGVYKVKPEGIVD